MSYSRELIHNNNRECNVTSFRGHFFYLFLFNLFDFFFSPCFVVAVPVYDPVYEVNLYLQALTQAS